MKKRFIRLLYLGAFLFSGIYGQQLPMPDDINNDFEHQIFRKYHDLSVYKLYSPYGESLDSSLTNTMVGYSPVLYTGGAKGDVFSIRAWGSARIKNWSLLIEPVVVNNPQGQNLLGSSFTRFGINGRIRNAFIRYTGESAEVQIGRAPLFWGQSFTHSIIHTTTGPTYDHVSVKINFANIQFEIFSGQLGPDTTNVDVRIKRLTAGHRMLWISPSNKWMISVGEQVMYTGTHRSLEFMYINPFVPYFFSALEGDELYDPNDSDNSIIFFTARYNITPSFSLYNEIIIDDFQVDENNVKNQYGLRMGADGAFSIGKIPLSWASDFTKMNSWTNIHYGQSTSWVNRGHALGYVYGTDLWAVHFQCNTWLSKKVMINLDYTLLGKGKNTLQTNFDGWEETNESFPSEPVINHSLLSVSVNWINKLGIIEAGISSIPFANEIAYAGLDQSSDSGVFLKYQYIFQKGFNIQ